jgi:dihydrofolate synthase / folylpolyglutamate synthase
VSEVADLAALYARRPLGMRLGLEVVASVYERLGRPAAGLPAIHVVGTNGKGSTSAMAAHALSRRGRRVGLTTSPHLHRIGERVAIDGVASSDEAMERWIDRVLAHERGVALPRPLTFFEVITLAAFVGFSEQRVDTLVVEAGLGGRLDATRIVAAAVTAITSIAMDHAEYLGDTLAKVAAEKAAVMARGVPVVTAPQTPEVAEILAAHARAVGAPLAVTSPLRRAPVGLSGAHQAENAAVALAAARVLEPSIEPADLDGVCWPGRLETLAVGTGALVLDVAHNPAGIHALVRHLAGSDTRIDRIVFGCMADKDAEAMVATLHELGVPLHFTDAADEGSHPGPASIHDRLAREEAWPAIATWLSAGEHVLVCGSLRLVGAISGHVRGEPEAAPQDPVRPQERR